MADPVSTLVAAFGGLASVLTVADYSIKAISECIRKVKDWNTRHQFWRKVKEKVLDYLTYLLNAAQSVEDARAALNISHNDEGYVYWQRILQRCESIILSLANARRSWEVAIHSDGTGKTSREAFWKGRRSLDELLNRCGEAWFHFSAGPVVRQFLEDFEDSKIDILNYQHYLTLRMVTRQGNTGDQILKYIQDNTKYLHDKLETSPSLNAPTPSPSADPDAPAPADASPLQASQGTPRSWSLHLHIAKSTTRSKKRPGGKKRAQQSPGSHTPPESGVDLQGRNQAEVPGPVGMPGAFPTVALVDPPAQEHPNPSIVPHGPENPIVGDIDHPLDRCGGIADLPTDIGVALPEIDQQVEETTQTSVDGGPPESEEQLQVETQHGDETQPEEEAQPVDVVPSTPSSASLGPTTENDLPGDAASDVVPDTSATGQAQAEEAGQESEQSPSTSEDDVEEEAFSLEEDVWDIGSAMGPAPDPDAYADARSIVKDVEYGSPEDVQTWVTDMETLIKVCLVAQDWGLMDGSPPSRVRKQIQVWATKLLPDYIPGINADPLTPEAKLKQWLPAVELDRLSAVQLEKLLVVAGLEQQLLSTDRECPLPDVDTDTLFSWTWICWRAGLDAEYVKLRSIALKSGRGIYECTAPLPKYIADEIEAKRRYDISSLFKNALVPEFSRGTMTENSSRSAHEKDFLAYLLGCLHLGHMIRCAGKLGINIREILDGDDSSCAGVSLHDLYILLRTVLESTDISLRINRYRFSRVPAIPTEGNRANGFSQLMATATALLNRDWKRAEVPIGEASSLTPAWEMFLFSDLELPTRRIVRDAPTISPAGSELSDW